MYLMKMCKIFKHFMNFNFVIHVIFFTQKAEILHVPFNVFYENIFS